MRFEVEQRAPAAAELSVRRRLQAADEAARRAARAEAEAAAAGGEGAPAAHLAEEEAALSAQEGAAAVLRGRRSELDKVANNTRSKSAFFLCWDYV